MLLTLFIFVEKFCRTLTEPSLADNAVEVFNNYSHSENKCLQRMRVCSIKKNVEKIPNTNMYNRLRLQMIKTHISFDSQTYVDQLRRRFNGEKKKI